MAYTWDGKRAIVSGGTSGLGKHLALELARRRVRLVLIGRDRERLRSVSEEAMALGAVEVDTFSLDVGRDWQSQRSDGDAQKPMEDLERWTQYLNDHPIDLLINAVGKSDRGTLSDLSCEDLLEQWRVNVLTSFQMTRACWASLERAHGSVVTIASLAGLLAGPGLGGYPSAKHALVAMHRQWRLEAASSQVHFLLVCPGPIAREEQQDRYADLVASRGLNAEVSRPGGGVKVSRLDPVELSRRILQAIENRELELVLLGKARWLAALMQWWPSWADRILRNQF